MTAGGAGQSMQAIRKTYKTNPRPDNPKLIKLPFAWINGDEATMVNFKGRPLIVGSSRLHGGSEIYLSAQDLFTGNELSRFGDGYSFACGFVYGEELNVFATKSAKKDTSDDWTSDVNRFWTTDAKTWESEMVLPRIGDRYLFNTSVCEDPDGFIMAYESDKPAIWSTRLARSKDLRNWKRIPDLEFTDVVFANPTIRYIEPYYYLMLGTHRTKPPVTDYEYHFQSTRYVTFLIRSSDLEVWDVSPTRYPMLDADIGEGINNTDADLFEHEGNTYIYYITGDQKTWGSGRLAMYSGPLRECLEAYFPEGVPCVRYNAREVNFIH